MKEGKREKWREERNWAGGIRKEIGIEICWWQGGGGRGKGVWEPGGGVEG